MGRIVTLSLLLSVFLSFLIPSFQVMAESEDLAALEKKVALLRLGFGDYFIAHKLSAQQKKKSKEDLLEKSYPGTYTFVDNEVYVLTAEKNDTIIALYLKNEAADKTQLKQMVADLMMQFGDPTSEAHDQIIYWAYNEKGKISADNYNNEKKNGGMGIIATVKFKSKLTLSEALGEAPEKNIIHCIISSPRLLEKIYNHQ
jgi:hypothetical protein